MFLQYLFFRFRKHDMHHLITLTESFTWAELPSRHPDTGDATKAGFIPKIPIIVKYIMAFAVLFHGTQSIARMIRSHDMIYSKWYPFDASVSPAYELVNLSQVIFYSDYTTRVQFWSSEPHFPSWFGPGLVSSNLLSSPS
jgi:hypothetical protein